MNSFHNRLPPSGNYNVETDGQINYEAVTLVAVSVSENHFLVCKMFRLKNRSWLYVLRLRSTTAIENPGSFTDLGTDMSAALSTMHFPCQSSAHSEPVFVFSDGEGRERE